MRHNIMVTTLIDADNLGRAYYYIREENGKVLYCDALLPEEASCKYVLATTNLEKMIIMGTDKVIHPGEEFGLTNLHDGKSLFASDPKSLSAFSLLRYRLAEFASEKQVYYQDDEVMRRDEEKERIIAFLHSFFDEHIEKDYDKRPNLYFHILAQDKDMQKAFDDALWAWAPRANFKGYKSWAIYYLYQNLKETYKMELLEVNYDIQMELILGKNTESLMFPKHIMKSFENKGKDASEDGDDIFLCVQNSEAPLVFDIINLISMTNILPEKALDVRKTIACTYRSNVLANEIVDLTRLQNISVLLSGIEAFLKYGKTKIIVDYWKQANVDNPTIERIIYAMRNIDNGISLCDLTDIERGIRSLREIIRDWSTFKGSSPVEQAFNILIEAIRRDYGKLLETDQIEFIDLVRWAYRKEFWQQTLTLIESRAPRDFVEKGFYFYCDSEDDKEQVIKIFGQEYWDLKSYEKYKMDDLPHYYTKFYNRSKANRSKHGNEYIQGYARLRVEELDSQDEKEIRACSICPDRSALENLLFAYYYLGDVRNSTNHANSSFDGFTEIMKDSDSGERMETIRQSVDYFLHCYDKVTELVEGKEANVIYITNEEILEYVNGLREEARKSKKQF